MLTEEELDELENQPWTPPMLAVFAAARQGIEMKAAMEDPTWERPSAPAGADSLKERLSMRGCEGCQDALDRIVALEHKCTTCDKRMSAQSRKGTEYRARIKALEGELASRNAYIQDIVEEGNYFSDKAAILEAENKRLRDDPGQWKMLAENNKRLADVHWQHGRNCEKEIATIQYENKRLHETIALVWKALGIETYEQASGKEISEIVATLQEKLDRAVTALEEICDTDTEDKGLAIFEHQRIARSALADIKVKG